MPEYALFLYLNQIWVVWVAHQYLREDQPLENTIQMREQKGIKGTSPLVVRSTSQGLGCRYEVKCLPRIYKALGT